MIRMDQTEFEYLSLQCGDISDHLTTKLCQDNVEWKRKYHEALYERYYSILPFLPDRAFNILDVGSGLGGIDILLHSHYEGLSKIHLLDGDNDPPSHVKADTTFCNMEVADAFMKRNGVPNMTFVPSLYALRPRYLRPIKPPKMDLIVSFASYCFHFSPEAYLDYLLEASKPDTVLILDVRTGRPDWHQILIDHFGEPIPIVSRTKWERMVYRGA